MSSPLAGFAQIDPEGLRPQGPLISPSSGVVTDLLLIVAAGLAVSCVALLYLRLMRRRRRRQRAEPRITYRPPPITRGTADAPVEAAAHPQADPGDSAPPPHHHRRRRRRRRGHRNRNPSLAETGGLPAPRPPGEMPPGL